MPLAKIYFQEGDRKEMIKVSIVLPTYNGAKYIRQSIDSCLDQTYKNIELIIVDDGSTDETPEIIKSYNDERIKYTRHEKNKGLPHALNTGFANVTGEYLTWTSDDNYYHEEAIEKMLSFLKTKNCEFVYCDYYTFEGDDPSNRNLIRLPKYVTFERINCVRACFLYSREIKEVIGDYDPDTELAEDYDYWIRVSKKFPMHHSDEPLYFYRVHNESLYSSRYYEVEVVKLLVRLKYNIMGIDQVTDLFIDLVARKKGGFFKLNEVLAKILFSKKINVILKNVKMRKLSFKEARFDLKNLVDSKLIGIW
jgi:glycosyltransferase involved in cell wall biosynthesis